MTQRRIVVTAATEAITTLPVTNTRLALHSDNGAFAGESRPQIAAHDKPERLCWGRPAAVFECTRGQAASSRSCYVVSASTPKAVVNRVSANGLGLGRDLPWG